MRIRPLGWRGALLALAMLLGANLAAWPASPAASRRASARLHGIPTSALPRTRPTQHQTRQALSRYDRLALRFEANRGQTDSRVSFLARGAGYTLFLTPRDAILALPRPSSTPRQQPLAASRHAVGASLAAAPARMEGTALRLRFVGASTTVRPLGEDRLPGESSYLVGRDPRAWRRAVPGYARVVYPALYPGIDLIYHGRQGQLEYDLIVAPGASPRRVTLAVQGTAAPIRLDAQGRLMLPMAGATLRLNRPVVYQQIGGVRHAVAGRYVLRGGAAVGFALGRYDRRFPLVIDPVLVYSTYLGGSGRNLTFDIGSLSGFGDAAAGIAVDSAGHGYVVGATASLDFPTTTGAFSRTLASANGDVFVSAFSASGGLLYSTYLGGSYAYPDGDAGLAIAVDSSGHAYITGRTYSPDFPTTPNALQRTLPDLNGSAFVAELSADGSHLLYSTFLGGSGGFDGSIEGESLGRGIAVDSAGHAYVTGQTASPNFPTTTGAFSRTLAGTTNAFVSELSADGSQLLYSTYLGGRSVDEGAAIAVDTSGHAYVTGQTNSGDFPTTTGAFSRTMSGLFSAFVTELSADGSHLVYSTFLGPTDESGGVAPNGGIAVDGAGHAFVTGTTISSDFPTTPGAFQRTLSHSGASNAFVSELSAGGRSLVYSSYLGGGGDSGAAIALDSADHAYVTGQTYSSNFPTTANAFSRTVGADGNAFVTEFSADGSSLVYSTYLGGSGNLARGFSVGDAGAAIAVDAAGHVYVTGHTDSSDFPTTPGALARGLGSINGNAFVTALNTDGSGLRYSTYLGGSGGGGATGDAGGGVAVDGAGNVYITGATASANFPTTPGVLSPAPRGGYGNAFVTKLSATGALVYSTYLGGNGSAQGSPFDGYGDAGLGIAVDSAGHAYVTGRTTSTDFPTTTGAFSRTLTDANGSAFVAELNADGSSLVYSTYLGGSGLADPFPLPLPLFSGDVGAAIAVDSDGHAYVTGQTASRDFPTTPNAFQRTLRAQWGGSNAFVTEVNAGGGSLVYSTYLGGSGKRPFLSTYSGDGGAGIALDSAGHAYVTGFTTSADFPTTTGAFSRTLGTPTGRNAFVAELSAGGGSLLYSTYLGGHGDDAAYGVAVDGAGHAFVTGRAYSPDFPTTTGAFSRTLAIGAGGSNAFVTEFSADGGSLVYSTYLGGSGSPDPYGGLAYPYGDCGNAIALDSAGHAYITGFTNSPDFPTTSDAISRTLTATYGSNAFVSELSADGGSLIFSSYLGGHGSAFGDDGAGIAVSGAGTVYVTGSTDSADFPTTANALSRTRGSPMGNAFVSSLAIPQPSETPTPPPSPTTQPTATPTGTPTATPTSTPSATPTSTPTATPTSTPTATPAAHLVIAPVTVHPFQGILLAGSAFGAGERVAIYWDSRATSALTTTIAGSAGAFVTRITVPPSSAGFHALIAVGQSSGRAAYALARVVSVVVLARIAGQAGSRNALAGFGFGKQEIVKAYWMPGNLPLGPGVGARTTTLGTFAGSDAITFTVPLSPTGTYHVVAIGQSSGAAATSAFHLGP